MVVVAVVAMGCQSSLTSFPACGLLLCCRLGPPRENCVQYCDMLGGTIGLSRSDNDKHTVFWFCIPVSVVPPVVWTRLGAWAPCYCACSELTRCYPWHCPWHCQRV